MLGYPLDLHPIGTVDVVRIRAMHGCLVLSLCLLAVGLIHYPLMVSRFLFFSMFYS
jgi:hypothetical protein